MVRTYRDRDYVFGQMILTLRSAIGLTQTGLAEHLGISRFAVGEWEAGSKYPKTEHLKTFVELAVQQTAFSVGHEADEIRTLWKAARQKVLLDEQWLNALLTTPSNRRIDYSPLTGSDGTRVDWGDALAIPHFYGREWELNLLTMWMVEKRCRVISTLGLGGIGKSALAVKAMRQVAEHFEVVIWRSLRDAPDCETLIDHILRVFDPALVQAATSRLEQRFSLLLDTLRRHRVLLVFDNFESILEEKDTRGQMRPGYEGYGHLLRQIAETEHQSCLLLTSREKPAYLAPLEGKESVVRSLRLTQLDSSSCQQLLTEKGIAGAASERSRLIELYAGNPLALKIVAQTIVDIFDGEIAPLLEQGEIIFGGVRELLNQQFSRLSPLEQKVLVWLAILREPTTLTELSSLLAAPVQRMHLLETLEALHRRSLVERGQKPGSFTLQSVVLEYMTARLIEEVSSEIEQGKMAYLVEYGLTHAQVHEYIRQIQQRLILKPILTRLHTVYQQRTDVEVRLLTLLDHLRTWAETEQGYAPANIVALLRELRGHLRGLDLGQLSIRGVYLRSTEMQDTSLAGANLHVSSFNDTFDILLGIACTSDGTKWASGSGDGEIRIWEANGLTLSRIWQAHVGMIWSLVFTSDNKMLATVGFDGMVKTWDVESATLLWVGDQQESAYHVAFAPNEDILATSGGPGVTIWDANTGQKLQVLPHPSLISPLVWSSDGSIIATGDIEGVIRLWDMTSVDPATSVRLITRPGKQFNTLAISPDGHTLASGTWDGIIDVWDVQSGSLIQTLPETCGRSYRLAWDPSGHILAIGGLTPEIRLWNAVERTYQNVLYGHSGAVMGLTFTPDGTQLISAAGDGTLRVWEMTSGRCIRILQGRITTGFDHQWHSDGTKIISGGSNGIMTIYGVDREPPTQATYRGHTGSVVGVSCSPDGTLYASCSWDNDLRIWNAATAECVQVLQDPDDPPTMIYRIGWSPDGQRFVGTRYLSYQGVLVWEFSDSSLHSPRTFLAPQPDMIHHAAWSPDSQWLAGGSESGQVYVWDATTGEVQHHFTRHQWPVKNLTWRPDGTQLATGGRGAGSGEIMLWDIQSGEYMRSLHGHSEMVCSLAWGADEHVIISGGNDGAIRWWDTRSSVCLLVQEAHKGVVQTLRRSPDGKTLASGGEDGATILWDLQTGDYLQTLRRDRPYERMDITGIRGLTEAQRATLRQLGAIEHD